MLTVWTVLVFLDDTMYDTVFQTVSSITLILRIHVPLSLSSSPPVFTLAGVRARHAWLDAEKVVGYAPISTEYQWQQSRMLLGAVVHEVVKHLQVNPPDVLEILDAGLRSIQPLNGPFHPNNGSNVRNNGTSNVRISIQQSAPTSLSSTPTRKSSTAPPTYEAMLGSTSSSQPLPNIPLPAIPTQFPELDNLNKDELEELLQDELAVRATSHRTAVMKEIEQVRYRQLEQNARKAEKHLAQEQEIQELHQSVRALHEELVGKVEEFQQLEQEQDRYCGPADTKAIVKQLTRAAKAALDASEQIAEQWLEADNAGAVVDEFLAAFLEKRTLHHLRAAKLEVIQHNGSSDGRK
jgi:Modifier of rudimentary (Mod(r)) protein